MMLTSCILTQEHKRVEQHFHLVQMPIQLHIGPFFCCYGISLCHLDYDYDSNLKKVLELMNEAFKSVVDRHQLIEYLQQQMVMVKVRITSINI